MENNKAVLQKKDKRFFDLFTSGLLFAVSIINLFLIDGYSKNAAIYLGCLLLLTSLILLIKNRKDKKYILLFGIILYTNFSIFISDILANGTIVLPKNTLAWQIYRNTEYEIKLLNALLIFTTIINLIDSISRRFFAKNKDDSLLKEDTFRNKSNLLIYLICCSVLIIGLMTGYRNSSIDGNYLSATSTLYEYCIMFLLFAWYYAGDKKSRHVFIIIIAIIYVIQALVYGDRSSAFPMIMLLVILYLKRLSIPKILIAATIGVLAANVISVYRQSYSLSDFVHNYTSRYNSINFASDTVSQSYYTGMSTLYVRESVENPPQYFFDYLIGLVVGGRHENADVTALAKNYATNKGGGMIVSDYYFWFGYYGVIVEAVIIGIIIAKLKNEKNQFIGLWKTYITVMVFRWYLYGSFVFFRSCLIIFPVVYGVFWVIHNYKKRRCENNSIIVREVKGRL
ncbi:O-antigen polysaccharide polymerase Wzy [Candidatus Saccharibacteria bacterium]|nr:O-antigen polysaccharide polymerase Wzy [Candidatus Saccharibacteria bacterium]